MSAENPGSDTPSSALSAEDLRDGIADRAKKKASTADQLRIEKETELQSIFKEFLEVPLGQKELDEIRDKIVRASTDGLYEVQVLEFPAKTCSDGGRAINNNDPNWPTTLQGKAKDFYDFFVARGRSQGFKLKAMINNFPDDLPGDVGLFVSWER
ncbi:MAG: hypothetical protein ABJN98_05005 [Roseibium sp.]